MKGLITSERNGVEHQFSDDGWFNATSASKPFGKDPVSWLRQRETAEYITALAKHHGKSGFLTEFHKISGLDGKSTASRNKLLSLVKKTGFVKTKSGSPENGGGTWLHPKLAVRFAQWLDVSFAIWCDEQIDQLLRGKHPVLDKKRLRHQTASTFKALTAVLQQTLEKQGKEVKRYHFMNEARLINWALNGEFKGLDRDSLSYEELDLLASLEVQDLILVASQCSYEQRKTALSMFAQSIGLKHLQHAQNNVLEA